MYYSDENCVVCNGNYVYDDDWISCDTCYLWYHRECANLQDDEGQSSNGKGVYTCPLCQLDGYVHFIQEHMGPPQYTVVCIHCVMF